MQNVKVSSLLKSELVLLKGLRYDLIVHAPFIEIDGFLEVNILKTTLEQTVVSILVCDFIAYCVSIFLMPSDDGLQISTQEKVWAVSCAGRHCVKKLFSYLSYLYALADTEQHVWANAPLWNISLQDLKELASLPEHQEAGLSVDKFDKARHSAIGAAKSLMMSDAVLLFPPGQLALAALRSGFKSVDSRLDPYLKRVLEKSNIKVSCCAN